MRKTLLLFFFCFFISQLQAQEVFSEKRILKLMGCRFEITAIAVDKPTAIKAVDAGIAEISRIEDLISEWLPSSQVSMINNQAGIAPVKVDRELIDLIFRSKKVSELTNGAFDISFASMEKIWNFDRSEHELPDSATVKNAARHINWQNVLLDIQKQTVFLKETGMRIGFGAIGKGYAANRAKLIMTGIAGVTGGLVNASGDLIAWGQSNHKDGWSIQIADPKDKSKTLGWLRLNDLSIVTSGDYEKYFTSKGIRYAHIINPQTGYPITAIKSATIICPDAELSDALATSVCVLGVEKGLSLVNRLKGVECLIIDANDNIFTSEKLQLNYYK